jgi:hypothetical protein
MPVSQYSTLYSTLVAYGDVAVQVDLLPYIEREMKTGI